MNQTTKTIIIGLMIAGIIVSALFWNKPESKPIMAISTQGLVGYWKMDDNLPTTAVIDETGVNNGAFNDTNGNPNTDTHSVVSHHERALTFDGADDYVNCGTDASLGPTNELSIELWVKLNDVISSQYLINRGYGNGYSIYYKNDVSGFWFAIDDGAAGNRDILSGNLGYTTSDWYHVVGTWNGTNLKIYVNGISYGTETGTNLLGSSGTFYICSYFGTPTIFPFNGTIDEVRIYDRALGAEEIALHYFLGSETRIKNATIY